MRNTKNQILLGLLFSWVLSQQSYRSVESIQSEWNEHASYQKEERLSFCDFLFKERHFERCLLTAFQLLYQFPDDPISPTISYYIARCYEEMQVYDLAHQYYRQVLQKESESSLIYKAANYRDIYVHLLAGEVSELLEATENTDDPYMITFRGYAQMKKMMWEEARLSFINAQALFSHSHYNKLMGPLYQTIENVGSVPTHNRYLVFLSGSLMPGGGQFMLREWEKGQGILTSVGLMALIGSWGKVESFVDGNRFIDSEGTSIPLHNNYKENNSHKAMGNANQIPIKMNVRSSSLKYSIPPLLIGAGIFIGSTWKSFIDTQSKNERLVEFYIEERIDKISPSRFLDFPEPTLILKEE
jgi:tetratricopeptide (TPR) repeat protein